MMTYIFIYLPGLRSVPAKPEAGFPQPGFLVLNLTNLWFWYPGRCLKNSLTFISRLFYETMLFYIGQCQCSCIDMQPFPPKYYQTRINAQRGL